MKTVMKAKMSGKKRKKGFDHKMRTMVLLWCDRHCCLCKKACGVNIEVHHINPKANGGPNSLDNAMPLCFDCHSEVGRYNNLQPRGTKYKIKELRSRREQIYEEFTRHLVPPIHYAITNIKIDRTKREYPDTGFTLTHRGSSLPVKVRTVIEVLLRENKKIKMKGHYGGKILWNVNPQLSALGHFKLPDQVKSHPRIKIRVSVTIIDKYGREHENLPIHYVYVRRGDYWYYDA